MKKNKNQNSALREFLRGYLHEDWKEEHNTIEQAVRRFCQDADPEQRNQVRREWLRLEESLKTQSLAAISRRLRELGSAWQPSSGSDLEKITRVLQRYPST